MRGGFLHNEVLVKPLAEFFQQRGAVVQHEFPVGPGRTSGFVDLFVVRNEERIVCEVELSPTRAVNDLRKAIQLRATLLLIITPRRAVAKAIERQITNRPHGLDIYVGTSGIVRQQLAQRFANEVTAECPSDINT